MAYARRGKKFYKKRKSYRRSYRNKKSKFARAVKRIARRAVSKQVETKIKYDLKENVELAAGSPGGAVYKDELSVKILKGLGGRHRLGREILLSGLRFKHIVKAERTYGPIYVRWCIMEHIGKNALTDSPFITTDRQEETLTFMDGAQGIFTQINTQKWRYLMGNSYTLLPEHTRGDWNNGGRIVVLKNNFKKFRKKIFYPEVERQVDQQGMDYWPQVEAERPIYLFAFARCMDNNQEVTIAPATMQYELQLQFKDA